MLVSVKYIIPEWNDATYTAVVVLAETALVSDHSWAGYIHGLSCEAREKGSFTGFFPVTVDSIGVEFGFTEQALRWDQWDLQDSERYRRLGSDLTHEFCRMIRNGLYRVRDGKEPPFEASTEKIQVFISHTKHDCDGKSVALTIRDWIHENSHLKSFIDVYDIPPGQSFHDVILHEIEVGALMAVHTDSYSSREWCRREVIEAKRRMVPMIVIDCIRDLDPRGFPYLGNVPVIRMDPKAKNRGAAAVGCLLDELFRSRLWRFRTEELSVDYPEVLFSVRPPELISLAALQHGSGRIGSFIVYPEPLMSADEQVLFSKVAPEVHIQTLTEWRGNSDDLEH